MRFPTDVPKDASPALCPYCDQPFPREDLLILHVGLEHGDTCDQTEHAAFERALDAETEDVRLFQIKAVGMLVVLYFGLLITYAAVT